MRIHSSAVVGVFRYLPDMLLQIASHVSYTIDRIVDSPIRNNNEMVAIESPVARKYRVTLSLWSGRIAFQNTVSFFVVKGLTNSKMVSNDSLVILKDRLCLSGNSNLNRSISNCQAPSSERQLFIGCTHHLLLTRLLLFILLLLARSTAAMVKNRKPAISSSSITCPTKIGPLY